MRIREERNCFKCQKKFSELFRCKTEQKGNWYFLCKLCLDKTKIDNIFYQYGGTWKSKKN